MDTARGPAGERSPTTEPGGWTALPTASILGLTALADVMVDPWRHLGALLLLTQLLWSGQVTATIGAEVMMA